MTLYVSLNINGKYPIDTVSITRIKGHEGERCVYKVHGCGMDFEIDHNYDDGAYKLTALVMEELYKRGGGNIE
jgi:hypothetical protein